MHACVKGYQPQALEGREELDGIKVDYKSTVVILYTYGDYHLRAVEVHGDRIGRDVRARLDFVATLTFLGAKKMNQSACVRTL